MPGFWMPSQLQLTRSRVMDGARTLHEAPRVSDDPEASKRGIATPQAAMELIRTRLKAAREHYLKWRGQA